MNDLMKQYPVDILVSLFVLMSYVFFYYAGYDQIYVFIGIPALFFIPGFLFTLALFPKVIQQRRFQIYERMILSVVFSLAIIALIGIALNYTRFGLTYQSSLFGICILSVVFGVIAFIRWQLTNMSNRYSYTHEMKRYLLRKRSCGMLDIVYLMVFVSTVLFFLVFVSYYLVNPVETNEQFTEFFLLNKNQTASDYPTLIAVGDVSPVLIGVSNYEGKPMNYTIEIWLLNQTITTDTNETVDTTYHDVWLLDSLQVQLPDQAVSIDGYNPVQWIHEYPLQISHSGEHMKLSFLLFNSSAIEHRGEVNTLTFPEEVYEQAYKKLFLWVTVFTE